MKRLCVIGGSGFVGTHLIRKLNANYEVTIFDKVVIPEFESQSKKIDIRDLEALTSELKDFDSIIHLAAEHKDNVTPKTLYHDVNVVGTRNVLKAMDVNGIHNIVFTSSVAVYGLNKENPSETHNVDPFNEYGKTKYLAELEIEKWFNQDPIQRSAKIIRPTVIFGEANRGNVYNLLKQIVSGRFLMIGDGKNVKSMAYVKNVTGFIEYLLTEKNGYEIYNYADKPDLTISDLISVIEKSLNIVVPSIRIPYRIGLSAGYVFDILSFITGKKLPVSSVRIKKFCATTQFDSSKIQKTAFNTSYSITDGLKKTLQNEFK